MSTRLLPMGAALLLTASAVGVGCAEKKDPAQKEAEADAKAEAAARVATSEEGTLVAMRLSKPGTFLDSVAAMAKPGYQWRSKLDGLSPKAAVAIDWAAPVRLVVGARKRGSPNRAPVVFSVGITSKDNVVAALAHHGIDAGSGTFERDDVSCEIGERRTICWNEDRASAESFIAKIDEGPVGADPELAITLDSAGLAVFNADVDSAMDMLPLVTNQMRAALTDDAFADASVSAIEDLMKDGRKLVFDDLERVGFKLRARPDKSGLDGIMDVTVDSKTSALTRLIFRDQPTSPPPAAFWGLPSGVLGAGYQALKPALDDPAIVGAKARGRELARGAARELGLDPKEIDGLIDSYSGGVESMSSYAWAELAIAPPVDSVLGGTDLGNHQLMAGTPAWAAREPALVKTVAYLNRADVREKLASRLPLLEHIQLREGPDPSLGETGWSALFAIPAESLGLPGPLELNLLGTSTDQFGWVAFGPNGAALRSTLQSLRAGEVPTLADDPMAQRLRDRQAHMASMYPLSPAILNSMFSSLGLTGIQVPETPGSDAAIYSRIVFRDDGMRAELDVPGAALATMTEFMVQIAALDGMDGF